MSPADYTASPGTGTRQHFPGALMRLFSRTLSLERPSLSDLPVWCSIAFACGAAVYFCLPMEPPIFVAAITAGVAVLAAGLCATAKDRPALLAVFVLAAFLCAGLVRGQIRTVRLDAPVVTESERARTVTGWIEAVQRSNTRERLILRVQTLEGSETPPVRVRVTAGRGHFVPGDAVQLRAVLGPPPRPAAPGGYDGGFAAYFRQLGGTGFAVSRPEHAEVPGAARQRAFARWRWHLAERIRSRAPPRSAGIAAALLTGDRSGIDPADAESLRASGLGHILAISGLHMALFAGGVFFAVRMAMAALEPFARRYDPRIPAAVTALVAGLAYLLISGAAIPTQRAFIMTATVLVGVLAGRQALSMRSVALAAFVVLLIQPESIVTPGFQMSFAAAAALIAAFQFVRDRRTPSPHPGFLRRSAGSFAATGYSSLIAGAATGGFAAFHFNRLAAFGFLANLAAMPVFSLIVMPAGVVALLLMPLGLEEPALAAMGWGLNWVLWIADSVSHWPGALTPVAAGPGASLPLYALGFTALVTGRGAIRLGGLAIMAMALQIWTLADPPDGLVTEGGVVIARFDGSDGQWGSSATRRSRFAARVFLERSGDRDAGVQQGMDCDQFGCVGQVGELHIATPESEEILLDDCRYTDLVVTRLTINRALRARCGTHLIDAGDLQRSGARTFWINDDLTLRWQTVREVRGQRPWTRAPGT
tara:strand:- start:4526 stop:6643 length:2118 start_codon:yes stop_codon:yes gene_type:complete